MILQREHCGVAMMWNGRQQPGNCKQMVRLLHQQPHIFQLHQLWLRIANGNFLPIRNVQPVLEIIWMFISLLILQISKDWEADILFASATPMMK